LIDGEQQLFRGIRAMTAPGHAPGLMALLFTLPKSGSILLAPTRSTPRSTSTRTSGTTAPIGCGQAERRKLMRIAAEENAMMLFGHDLAQWRTLRQRAAVLRLTLA
jgi:N-acyl homoserine lactone hydrolase